MLKISKEQWILVADVEVGCVSNNNAVLRMKESGLLVFNEGRDREQPDVTVIPVQNKRGVMEMKTEVDTSCWKK